MMATALVLVLKGLLKIGETVLGVVVGVAVRFAVVLVAFSVFVVGAFVEVPESAVQQIVRFVRLVQMGTVDLGSLLVFPDRCGDVNDLRGGFC